jgi:muramidase (phage lysozyme)
VNNAEARAALEHGNVQAFLRMLRVGEGTTDEDGYRRHFGGELAPDLTRHPRRAITKMVNGAPITSTACGAYQFLSRTWDDCQGALKLPDFGPESQDLAAVFLINRAGALSAVIAGQFEIAVAKCAGTWASLPGSPYGQPVITMARCKWEYEKWGGVYEIDTSPQPVEKPATPVHVAPRPDQEPHEGAPMVAPAVAVAGTFLWELAKSAIAAFTPLAQEKITKEIARHTDKPELADQIGRAIVETAVTVTGIKDPLAAVVEAKKNPSVVQQLETTALVKLDELMPMLERMHQWEAASWADEEASKSAAALRNNSLDGLLTKSIIALLAGVIVGLGALAAGLAAMGVDVQTIIGALLMLVGVVGSKFGTRYDYSYGSSRGSAAKDVLNAELARRPKG